jgi:hypothetical protein
MTDIEEKAQAFLKAVREENPHLSDDVLKHIAILRLIEQTKHKPDPLVEVLKDFGGFMPDADDFRAALEARGLEIREKANAHSKTD